MTKIRKPLIFTLCLLPVAAVGGWFTTQMSTASIDEKALETAIQQVGSKEMVMLITMIQTVVYAIVCGFFLSWSINAPNPNPTISIYPVYLIKFCGSCN